jgi:light-regulated signal transduction histidine kinase (bacteriophytochrome)
MEHRRTTPVPVVDVEYSRPILNILEDFSAERQRLGDTQTAVVNILDLIGNAIKFRGPDAASRVQVSCATRGLYFVFSVADSGIGIDPRHAERIFAIFQRLHTRGEYPGTGIGLALCKKVVERSGGEIWLESAPGKGSTFHFTLRAAGESV